MILKKKALNEVKLFQKINKNHLCFQGKGQVQKEVFPSCKMLDHLSKIKEDNHSYPKRSCQMSLPILSHVKQNINGIRFK